MTPQRMTPTQALDAEVTRKLGEVGLEDKADAMAASLSGGQKRKLSGMIQNQRQPAWLDCSLMLCVCVPSDIDVSKPIE